MSRTELASASMPLPATVPVMNTAASRVLMPPAGAAAAGSSGLAAAAEPPDELEPTDQRLAWRDMASCGGVGGRDTGARCEAGGGESWQGRAAG